MKKLLLGIILLIISCSGYAQNCPSGFSGTLPAIVISDSTGTRHTPICYDTNSGTFKATTDFPISGGGNFPPPNWIVDIDGNFNLDAGFNVNTSNSISILDSSSVGMFFGKSGGSDQVIITSDNPSGILIDTTGSRQSSSGTGELDFLSNGGTNIVDNSISGITMTENNGDITSTILGTGRYSILTTGGGGAGSGDIEFDMSGGGGFFVDTTIGGGNGKIHLVTAGGISVNNSSGGTVFTDTSASGFNIVTNGTFSLLTGEDGSSSDIIFQTNDSSGTGSIRFTTIGTVAINAPENAFVFNTRPVVALYPDTTTSCSTLSDIGKFAVKSSFGAGTFLACLQNGSGGAVWYDFVGTPD